MINYFPGAGLGQQRASSILAWGLGGADAPAAIPMNKYIKIFKHLLPKAEAFRLPYGFHMQQFFTGIAKAIEDLDGFLLDIWYDHMPQLTRELDAWETQFGLLPHATAVGDRRTALEAAWKMSGGQSPSYIQTTLRAAGFDVYVHEWWESLGPTVVRDPRNYIVPIVITDTAECGEVTIECGESTAECGILASGGFLIAHDGEDFDAGLTIPSDPDTWRHFWYIGAAIFPGVAEIPASREQEFKLIVTKIKPVHTWVGALINFI